MSVAVDPQHSRIATLIEALENCNIEFRSCMETIDLLAPPYGELDRDTLIKFAACARVYVQQIIKNNERIIALCKGEA